MKYSQKNIEQLFRLIGSFPLQKYEQTSHYEFIQTKDSIWPNQLINLTTSENQIEAVLNLIERESENGNIPNLLMLNPNTNSHLLVEKLRQRNYTSSLWYAMTHNLNRVVTLNANPDFKVIQVKSKNDLREWLSIVEGELMNKHSLNPVIFNSLLDNNSCYFFLGFEKQKPVATSLLFIHEKNAGVYLVSTKKSNRKKGFGLKMTNECLLKAKELKCKSVEIQATELGKGVYKTLGFIEQGEIDVFRIKRSKAK